MGTAATTNSHRNPPALRDLRKAINAARQFAQGKNATQRLMKLELFVRGQILARRRPHSDQTDFWSRAAKRFPSDTNFLRKKIDAALRAGRTADAEAGLEILLLTGSARAKDSKFVVGLVNVYSGSKDTPAVRKILRVFMKNLHGTPDYRIAAVRLSRLLFAHFPKSHGRARKSAGYANRFQRMLDKAPIASSPKKVLSRAIAMEQSLTAINPHVLLDTDISREQCEAFVRLVHKKLQAREPFSFVRVGDGEGSCLPYEPHLASFAASDAVERERIWWGKPVDGRLRLQMARKVYDAIWKADCIGVPTISRFLRDVRLDEDHALEDGGAGRGLRSILYALENFKGMRNGEHAVPLFTSCHLHQHLQRWELYPALFEGVREVVVVSCHPHLADIIEKRFGTHVAGDIRVPPEYASISKMRHRVAEKRRLPEMFDEVIEKMGDLPRNRLVLIGAGYLGKRLVSLARAKGGIALDLGSVFDYWVGAATRSYINLSSV